MPEIFSNSGMVEGTPGQMKDVFLQRSELMEEIVSDKPGFLIRWGNIFFLLILMLVCIACWFIKYPDMIKATAKLTSINAPKPVVCLVSGKLTKLNITENQVVEKGQVLGYIESTASHEAVLAFALDLDSIQILLNTKKADEIKKYFIGTTNQLGELQTAYQSFLQAFLSFKNYLPDGFYLKKMTMLLKDKANLKKLFYNSKEQEILQEQDLVLVQKTFEANKSLSDNKVISEFDYRSEESKLINKKLTLPQIRSSLIGNETQQIEKEKEMMELENTISQQNIVFQQALNTFKNQVDEWRKRYLLISPISGRVAFASFMQEHQQLVSNQIICHINPENSQYFAEITVPQFNFGKVAIGQQVLFRFQSYPFQEFGQVIGEIEFISHIPNENGYLAKVRFINGLTTSYGKQIQFRDGLLAEAEIVTRDMRLLQRFYFDIVKQVKK